MTALFDGAVVRVRTLAQTRTADGGRVAQVRERRRVVAGRRERALGEALMLLVLDRAHQLLRIDRAHVVRALEEAIAAEEPRLVQQRRSTDGERGVVRGELFSGTVLVFGDEITVLEEVVSGAAQTVAAGLGHDLRKQAWRAGELRRDAAGRHFLFRDDFRVHVGAERSRHRVGHVDAIEVIQIVGRHAERAADVAVVQTGARGRVARRARIVRQDARHELQIALIRAARRQGLGQTQGDVLAGGRARHVDERRRLGRHRHCFLDARERQLAADRQDLSDADALILANLLLEALHRDLHAVELGGLEQFQYRLAGLVAHRHALRDGIDGAGFDGGTRKRLPLLIGHEHFDRARRRRLRGRARRYSNCHRGQGDDSHHPLHMHSHSFQTRARDGRLGPRDGRLQAALRCGLNNVTKNQ